MTEMEEVEEPQSAVPSDSLPGRPVNQPVSEGGIIADDDSIV
jgi:hypothetical protein